MSNDTHGVIVATGLGLEQLELCRDEDGTWAYGFSQPGCLFAGDAPYGGFETPKEAYDEAVRLYERDLPLWEEREEFYRMSTERLVLIVILTIAPFVIGALRIMLD